jgi:hypothetical protein
LPIEYAEAGWQQNGSTHHPVVVHDEGDGSLASDDSSDEDGEGEGEGGRPSSPLTQDVLQQAYQSQQPPQNDTQTAGGMGSLPDGLPTRSTSSRGGNSWLRGRNGSIGGTADGASALDETSSVISLGDMGAETVSWNGSRVVDVGLGQLR